jgi:hypothetical protein
MMVDWRFCIAVGSSSPAYFANAGFGISRSDSAQPRTSGDPDRIGRAIRNQRLGEVFVGDFTAPSSANGFQ